MYSSDGELVGKVDEVVDNYREHILDGFVIETTDGRLRFADAPEVARTAERGVTLTIDAAAAAQLPAPERAPRDSGGDACRGFSAPGRSGSPAGYRSRGEWTGETLRGRSSATARRFPVRASTSIAAGIVGIAIANRNQA